MKYLKQDNNRRDREHPSLNSPKWIYKIQKINNSTHHIICKSKYHGANKKIEIQKNNSSQKYRVFMEKVILKTSFLYSYGKGDLVNYQSIKNNPICIYQFSISNWLPISVRGYVWLFWHTLFLETKISFFFFYGQGWILMIGSFYFNS